jgi:hypothetical protein
MVDERTPEERERLARIVHGLTARRMIQIMNETVGIKRSAELLGWAVLWGLSGELSGDTSVSDLRRKLEAQGMTYASAYRAISDYRKVSDAILALDEYQGPGLFESLRRLAAVVSF